MVTTATPATAAASVNATAVVAARMQRFRIIAARMGARMIRMRVHHRRTEHGTVGTSDTPTGAAAASSRLKCVRMHIKSMVLSAVQCESWWMRSDDGKVVRRTRQCTDAQRQVLWRRRRLRR